MRGHAYGVGRVTTTVDLPAEALTIVAAPPEMLSQRNVEAVTGIPARVYLEEIRASGFPLPVIKIGKLRLVDREAFVSHLRSRASLPACRPQPRSSGAAAVLAEVGIELGPAGAEEGGPPLPRQGGRGKIRRKK